jgi:hypothetical protein
LSVCPVAISTVLVLILVLPKIASLALAKTTALVAVLLREIPALFEAPVPLDVKAAIELAPVVVPETAVKSWRNITAEERLSAPISGYPSLATITLRPISINPRVVGTGTRRDIVSVSRRRLIETAASAKTYAYGESALCKHRSSSQEHHRQQFRFHLVSFLPAPVNAWQWPKGNCNGCGTLRILLGFFSGSDAPGPVFLGRSNLMLKYDGTFRLRSDIIALPGFTQACESSCPASFY